MEKAEHLEAAIAAQEKLRGVIDDAIINAAIAVLREKLTAVQLARRAGRQRKVVTVLFVDTVGSTALVRDLDPEDSLALLDGALARLSRPITEYGGRVTSYMGDGFKAVFGLPVARENDPEMAVRAGLGMLEAARAYAQELAATRQIEGYQVRVGVHTGLVATDSGTDSHGAVMGATVNLAAHLEKAAPPGGLLISHATYQHVRGIFDLQTMPPVAAKGFDEAVPVYRVLRAKPRAFRSRPRGVHGVEARLVGRDREMEALQQAWRMMMSSHHEQIVLVSGEAGLGKSRLLYEFEQWIDLQPTLIHLYRGRARQETQRLPYALLRTLFAFRFGIRENESNSVVREKLMDGFGAHLSDGAESVAVQVQFIGQLLGYDFGASPQLYAALDDPQQLRDRALLYLSAYFKAAAATTPLLFLLEDLHWADDSSLDALARLTLALGEQPVLLAGTARPTLAERRPDWLQQVNTKRLALQPLSGADSRRLVVDVLRRAEEVPESLQSLVVAQAEGNPFYMEELIKMLVEDGVIDTHGEQWQIQRERLAAVRVPPTLTGVLQARLDSLPVEERTLLQQAAVVGRVFWDEAVAFVASGLTASEHVVSVADTLQHLRNKEMIFRREPSTFAGSDELIFKHALLHEVTYESVPKQARQTYHSLVADWLASHGALQTGDIAGLIATHLEEAGRVDEARSYLWRAARSASEKYANEEALTYYNHALALTPAGNSATRWQLLLARDDIYDLQGARETQQENLERMADLAGDDAQRQAQLALAWANYYEVVGDFEAVARAAQAAIAQARAAKLPREEARGYLRWGRALWRQGAYEEATQRLEKAEAIARASGPLAVAGESLRTLGLIARLTGDGATARDYTERALQIARKIRDRRGEANARNNLGVIAKDRGDFAGAQRHTEEALALFREIGGRRGEGFMLLNLGAIDEERGDYATAHATFEQALQVMREIGDRHGEGWARNNLAWFAVVQGEYASGYAQGTEALALARAAGDRPGEGNALSVIGDALVGLGRAQEALGVFEEAIALQEELQQPQLAHECRAGRARALLALGRVAEARATMAPVLAFLETGATLEGTNAPFRIYLTGVRVLQAAADPAAQAAAERLLARAYALLLARAAHFIAAEDRTLFLKGVPWHRELVALWQVQQTPA